MSTSAATQAFSRSLWELFDSFVYWFLGKAVPDHLQHFLQFDDRFRFRMALVIGLQHCPLPDTVIQGVQVWWIWRPLVFGNEIWAVGLEPVLRDTSCVCWRAVLLEDVSTGQSKFINKELAVLLFTNTTSHMTSLTVSWLLVILNHWKNFERFSCTGFRTKIF